jgi:type VI secretion system protein VasJ
MLGSLSHNKHWLWTAVGKHPAAADYINIDGGSSLLEALADWMAKGYDEINRGSQNVGAGPYSWRFWLRGAKKGALICGIVRDSSDRIGRPYPLLIMGEGVVQKWEKQWELLPLDLIKTWQRMEFIASHRYEDVGTLTEALRTLTPPPMKITVSGQSLHADREADISAYKDQLQQNGRAFINLYGRQDSDAFDTARQWHAALKAGCQVIPRAVFWGGTPMQTYLSVYCNALNINDFVNLWTV